MPYVIVSVQNVCENGPTVCGDGTSDPELMEKCGAILTRRLGNKYEEYVSKLSPRVVLNVLEEVGYNVVGQSGPGQTYCVNRVALHKCTPRDEHSN